jgi:hypothetical protein
MLNSGASFPDNTAGAFFFATPERGASWGGIEGATGSATAGIIGAGCVIGPNYFSDNWGAPSEFFKFMFKGGQDGVQGDSAYNLTQSNADPADLTNQITGGLNAGPNGTPSAGSYLTPKVANGYARWANFSGAPSKTVPSSGGGAGTSGCKQAPSGTPGGGGGASSGGGQVGASAANQVNAQTGAAPPTLNQSIPATPGQPQTPADTADDAYVDAGGM